MSKKLTDVIFCIIELYYNEVNNQFILKGGNENGTKEILNQGRLFNAGAVNYPGGRGGQFCWRTACLHLKASYVS